jgi:hypothetical protein
MNSRAYLQGGCRVGEWEFFLLAYQRWQGNMKRKKTLLEKADEVEEPFHLILKDIWPKLIKKSKC